MSQYGKEIKTQNGPENYELVMALVERKEKLQEREDSFGIEKIDNILSQFEGTSAYHLANNR